MEHTPGPWKATAWDWECEGVWVSIASGHGVALARSPLHDLVHREEIAEANARLIAAAPDLLEACEVAIGYIESAEGQASESMPGHVYDAITYDLELVRAAIAKAQGGE